MDYAKANKRSWLRDQQILTHLNGAFGTMLLPDITAGLPIERYKARAAATGDPGDGQPRACGPEASVQCRRNNGGLFRGRNPVKGSPVPG